MSDDNFEEIVNADQDDEYPEFNDMMDVLFFFYKKFNPGSIPVKGIFIVESTAPGVPRRVEADTSSPMYPWEAIGLLDYVNNEIKSSDLLDTLGIVLDAGDGDDDE